MTHPPSTVYVRSFKLIVIALLLIRKNY